MLENLGPHQGAVGMFGSGRGGKFMGWAERSKRQIQSSNSHTLGNSVGQAKSTGTAAQQPSDTVSGHSMTAIQPSEKKSSTHHSMTAA